MLGLGHILSSLEERLTPNQERPALQYFTSLVPMETCIGKAPFCKFGPPSAHFLGGWGLELAYAKDSGSSRHSRRTSRRWAARACLRCKPKKPAVIRSRGLFQPVGKLLAPSSHPAPSRYSQCSSTLLRENVTVDQSTRGQNQSDPPINRHQWNTSQLGPWFCHHASLANFHILSRDASVQKPPTNEAGGYSFCVESNLCK